MIEPRYRIFWPRFWAGALDGLVFVPVSMVDRWVYTSHLPAALQASWFVCYSFLFVGYSVILHARFGQTLGKMAFHVKVLDVLGSKLSLGQAMLRDLVPIVFTVVGIAAGVPRILRGEPPYGAGRFDALMWIEFWATLAWFWAELVTMLTNSKRRAVHDFIAGSVVVRIGALRAPAGESRWSMNLLR